MIRRFALIFLVLLAACGGGSGGGDSAQANPTASGSPAVVVDSAVAVSPAGSSSQTPAAPVTNGPVATAPAATAPASAAPASGAPASGTPASSAPISTAPVSNEPTATTGTPSSDTTPPVPLVSGPLPPLAQGNPTTYMHILSTGQSLALGELSLPAISTTQPYDNLMLSPGLLGEVGPMRLLVEALGMEALRESPSSGMANTLRALDSSARPVVVGLHAQSAVPYSYLKKGGVGRSYAQGMAQASATKALVEAAGHRYQPIAVTVVHGEADYAGLSGARYADFLREWQSDYQSDINALTGSTAILPMFINQMNTGASGEIAVAQYNAHKNNPGRIFLVGPKYQYDYGPDRLHLTNVQSKHMGELLGKVIRKVVYEGVQWNPLMPRSVRRSGAVVTIDFNIPVGTLRLDTTTVGMRPNYGFDFVQTGGSSSITIQSVALIDGDTRIQITLSAVPDGTDPRIRYAWKCNGGGLSYQSCGRGSDGTHVGGNIRDSDVSISPAIGSTGLPLHNWLVTFEEPILP